MRNRIRTPLLSVTLSAIALVGVACGDDDDGDLDPSPTAGQDSAQPTQPAQSPEPPTNGGNGDGTPGGESPQPEPEGEIGGTITAQGELEGDFIPQSAIATVEGDLQVLLASQSGESAAIMVEGDGSVTMETYSAEQEVTVFTGSGAGVENAGDGTGVCGVDLTGTELTGEDGGSIQLGGELVITGANC